MLSYRHIIWLLLFYPIISFAQQKSISVTNIFRASVLTPSISYEQKVAQYQTFYGQVYFQPAIHLNGDFSIDKNESYIDPAFLLQYRYYYNFNRRQAKKKPTERNSLNYFSPFWTTRFSKERFSIFHYFEDSRRPVNYVGITWGFQRNYKNRFSLDINVGPCYLFTKSTMTNNNGTTYKINYGALSTFGNLSIGIWLN